MCKLTTIMIFKHSFWAFSSSGNMLATICIIFWSCSASTSLKQITTKPLVSKLTNRKASDWTLVFLFLLLQREQWLAPCAAVVMGKRWMAGWLIRYRSLWVERVPEAAKKLTTKTWDQRKTTEHHKKERETKRNGTKICCSSRFKTHEVQLES